MLAEERKVTAYFSHLATKLGNAQDVDIVVIAHMVPNTPYFIEALKRIANVAAIFSKPNSVGREEFKSLSTENRVYVASRKWSEDLQPLLDAFYESGLRGKNIILIDIGGYYAPIVSELSSEFDGTIVGILEGTENGVQKYEKFLEQQNGEIDIPIVTVARSPLKLPEDYLVGSSVVFSVEAVLREQAQILQTRRAAVIGYGRVGSAVAEILRNKGISTVVYDVDPVSLALAAAKGFQAYTRLPDALSQSNLVLCATGNTALDLQGFGLLRSGTVVASVTSSDDEFDLQALDSAYNKRALSDNITEYSENRNGGRTFYLIAGGNAANFIHGAVIGPAIQLIEGEKLACVSLLAQGRIPEGNLIRELGTKERQLVASYWNVHFLN